MDPLVKCGATFAAAVGLSLALSAGARADEIRTLPSVEIGQQFISGVAEESLTGESAYVLQFRSEAVRGTFRPSIAAEFLYSLGDTSVTNSTTDYKLYGGSFNPGYNVFLFKEGNFQPSLGFSAILGWQYLKLVTPPTGVEAYTQGFAYGFELSSGVDIRFARTESSALRLRAAMVYLKSRIGGQSAFGLGGFRFLAGFVY